MLFYYKALETESVESLKQTAQIRLSCAFVADILFYNKMFLNEERTENYRHVWFEGKKSVTMHTHVVINYMKYFQKY